MNPTSTERIVAVTGAAGLQGGVVARRLLADGWGVRALTRDVNKPAAQALAQAGAQVVPADNDDRASLERAFRGAYGVFAVQNYWLPGVGKEGEIRQGKNAAAAAKAAGIQHFVYSSVGAAHRGMGQLHFESKWEIEQFIQSLGLPYTILRPVAFMENYNYQRAAITNGVYNGRGLHPDKKTQIIAVEDVAAFVALALAHPEEFLGKTIELAGDELTEAQVAETLSRVIGRPVQLARRSAPEGAAPDPEMVAMFRFFNGEGYDADIPALRRLYPGLHTFEQWLRQSGYENAQPEPMPPAGGRWGA